MDPEFGSTEAWARITTEMGWGVLKWVGTVGVMGHTSPASTLTYLDRPPKVDFDAADWPEQMGRALLQDFVGWIAGDAEAEARIRDATMDNSMRMVSEAVGKVFQ